MGWTVKDTKRLKVMWANGITAAQIAIDLRKSRNAVLGKVWRMGLERGEEGQGGIRRKPGAWTADEEQILRTMWAEGRTRIEIAHTIGRGGVGNISRKARTLGLVPRWKKHGGSRYSQYTKWFSLKRSDDLVPEWCDAPDRFAEHFGERPSAQHFLKKHDETKPFGPANGAWMRVHEFRENRMRLTNLDSLKNDIVKPGIDKFLVPLALYRGGLSLGRIHQLWNFAIAMMHSECAEVGDALYVLQHNPKYAHLCGPHSRISANTTIDRFFSRLSDNPRVTGNVPGLTEYVRSVPIGGFPLERISLYSPRSDCVPWRVYKKPNPKIREIKQSEPELFYPFLMHDPKDTDGGDLVVRVNNAVPKGLPEQIRADICQDIIVAILSGELSESELDSGGDIRPFITAGRKLFADKWKHVSLDAPMFGDSSTTMHDVTG